MHLKLLGLCRFFYETQHFFEVFEIPRTGASVILIFFIKYLNPVILLILKIFKYPEPMVLSFCFFPSKYHILLGLRSLLLYKKDIPRSPPNTLGNFQDHSMLTHFLFTRRVLPHLLEPHLLRHAFTFSLIKMGSAWACSLTPIHPSTSLTLRRGCFESRFSRVRGVQRNSPSSHPSHHDLNAVKHSNVFCFLLFVFLAIVLKNTSRYGRLDQFVTLPPITKTFHHSNKNKPFCALSWGRPALKGLHQFRGLQPYSLRPQGSGLHLYVKIFLHFSSVF